MVSAELEPASVVITHSGGSRERARTVNEPTEG